MLKYAGKIGGLYPEDDIAALKVYTCTYCAPSSSRLELDICTPRCTATG